MNRCKEVRVCVYAMICSSPVYSRKKITYKQNHQEYSNSFLGWHSQKQKILDPALPRPQGAQMQQFIATKKCPSPFIKWNQNTRKVTHIKFKITLMYPKVTHSNIKIHQNNCAPQTNAPLWISTITKKKCFSQTSGEKRPPIHTVVFSCHHAKCYTLNKSWPRLLEAFYQIHRVRGSKLPFHLHVSNILIRAAKLLEPKTNRYGEPQNQYPM